MSSILNLKTKKNHFARPSVHTINVHTVGVHTIGENTRSVHTRGVHTYIGVHAILTPK